MLRLGQKVTYMERKNAARNLPQRIRISTIYDPVLHGGCWETMVFDQKQIKAVSGEDRYTPLIGNHCTKDGSAGQHERVVKQYKTRGYAVTGQDEDCILKGLEAIPAFDLLDFTPEQWNKLKFIKYLREKGKI